MLKEHHHEGKFELAEQPPGLRGPDLRFPGRRGRAAGGDGKIDHEEYTQCEYGPHTAIWRNLAGSGGGGNVKATFLTCGAIAERYPAATKAIVAKGHEVAGHGYHHEVARDLTREQETDVMRRTTAMIRSVTGDADRLALAAPRAPTASSS